MNPHWKISEDLEDRKFSEQLIYSEDEHKTVRAESENGDHFVLGVYHLYSFGQIHLDYVVQASDVENVQGVSMSMPGVSTWFDVKSWELSQIATSELSGEEKLIRAAERDLAKASEKSMQ